MAEGRRARVFPAIKDIKAGTRRAAADREAYQRVPRTEDPEPWAVRVRELELPEVLDIRDRERWVDQVRKDREQLVVRDRDRELPAVRDIRDRERWVDRVRKDREVLAVLQQVRARKDREQLVVRDRDLEL
jgi:hypothetical protein